MSFCICPYILASTHSPVTHSFVTPFRPSALSSSPLALSASSRPLPFLRRSCSFSVGRWRAPPPLLAGRRPAIFRARLLLMSWRLFRRPPRREPLGAGGNLWESPGTVWTAERSRCFGKQINTAPVRRRRRHLAELGDPSGGPRPRQARAGQ